MRLRDRIESLFEAQVAELAASGAVPGAGERRRRAGRLRSVRRRRRADASQGHGVRRLPLRAGGAGDEREPPPQPAGGDPSPGAPPAAGGRRRAGRSAPGAGGAGGRRHPPPGRRAGALPRRWARSGLPPSARWWRSSTCWPGWPGRIARLPGDPSRARPGGAPLVDGARRRGHPARRRGSRGSRDLRPLLRPRGRGRPRHRRAHPAGERVPPALLPEPGAARRVRRDRRGRCRAPRERDRLRPPDPVPRVRPPQPGRPGVERLGGRPRPRRGRRRGLRRGRAATLRHGRDARPTS